MSAAVPAALLNALPEDLRGPYLDTLRNALRDQLAVHAPAVPDWFDVPMERAPVPTDFGGEAVAWQAAVNRWKTRRAINRLVQWPYHYADLVLAERDVVQARGEQR